MKKVLYFILAFVMCISLCACGSSNKEPTNAATTAHTSSDYDKQDSDSTFPSVSAEFEANETEETQAAETHVTEHDKSDSKDDIRPEFKEAMDAYEAFYDEYCDFLKEYSENPTDIALLTKYSEMITKVAEMNEAFEAWNKDQLNNEELKYYLDVNNRVMQKLIDVAE